VHLELKFSSEFVRKMQTVPADREGNGKSNKNRTWSLKSEQPDEAHIAVIFRGVSRGGDELLLRQVKAAPPL
jgi:hypothetical protein